MRWGSLELITCRSPPTGQWWGPGPDPDVGFWSRHSAGTVLSPFSGRCSCVLPCPPDLLSTILLVLCSRSVLDALLPRVLLTSDCLLGSAWETLAGDERAGGEPGLACVSGLGFLWLLLCVQASSSLYSPLCSQVLATGSSLPDPGPSVSPGDL